MSLRKLAAGRSVNAAAEASGPDHNVVAAEVFLSWEFLMSLLILVTLAKVAALAEVAWSKAENRDWKSFYTRLDQHLLPRLSQYGVQFRPLKNHYNYHSHK